MDEVAKETPDKEKAGEDPEGQTCPDCGGEILVSKGTVTVCLGCGREF